MRYQVVLTDTDTNREPNYAWARTSIIEAPDRASRRLLCIRAKKAMGYTGVRMSHTCEMVWIADGMCVALIVIPMDWE